MTHTEASLLAAIREDLEADEPRLVFADWADEHGDEERAEFIRSQVEAASLPYWDPRRATLTARAETLYAKNRRPWTKKLKGTKVREYSFQRGFLDHIVLNGETSFRHADQIFADYPTIRSVKINKLRSRFNQLMAADWLRSIRILNLTNNSLGVKRTIALANNPQLAGLTSLELRSNNIRAKGMKAVMHSEALVGLERLGVESAQVESGDIASSVQGPLAARLQWLEIGDIEWENSGVPVWGDLLATSAFPRLKYLGAKIRANDESSLCASLGTDTFQQLEHFSLWHVTESEFEELCNHPHAANLRSFAYGSIPPWHARSINAGSAIWNRLEFLSVNSLPSEDEQIEMLQRLRCIHLPIDTEDGRQIEMLKEQSGTSLIRDWLFNDWQFGEGLDFVFGRDGWK